MDLYFVEKFERFSHYLIATKSKLRIFFIKTLS